MRALKAEGGACRTAEFVFLERATIGLGGAFLRLGARLNFHRIYEDAIAGFEAAVTPATPSVEAVGTSDQPPVPRTRRPASIG